MRDEQRTPPRPSKGMLSLVQAQADRDAALGPCVHCGALNGKHNGLRQCPGAGGWRSSEFKPRTPSDAPTTDRCRHCGGTRITHRTASLKCAGRATTYETDAPTARCSKCDRPLWKGWCLTPHDDPTTTEELHEHMREHVEDHGAVYDGLGDADETTLLGLDPAWQEGAAEEWGARIPQLKHDPLAALNALDHVTAERDEAIQRAESAEAAIVEWYEAGEEFEIPCSGDVAARAIASTHALKRIAREALSHGR